MELEPQGTESRGAEHKVIQLPGEFIDMEYE